MERTAVIVHLPWHSESLDYRPHLEPLGTATLLDWALDRLTSAVPHADRAVLAPSVGEAHQVRPACERRGIRLVVADRLGPTAAFASTVRDDTRTLAFLTLEACLGPADLVPRILSFHRARDANYTRLGRLPAGIEIEVFEASLLVALAELRLAFLPRRPAAAIDVLLTTSRASGHEPPMPIRKEVFDAVAEYGLDPTRLPESVLLQSRRDAEVAVAVAGEPGLADDPRAWMARWKSALTVRHARARDDLRGVRPTPSRRTGTKRVLYVSNASAYSGAEASLCQLVRALDGARYRAYGAVAKPGRLSRELELAGAEVTHSGHDLSGPQPENLVFCRNRIDAVRPDIVHINDLTSLPMTLCALQAGVPVVQHVRVPDPGGSRQQLYNADIVVAVSQFVRRAVLRYDVEPSRVEVVWNGIDLDHFSPGSVDRDGSRREFGIPADAKVVLMIGRFAPNKQHHVLIAAAAQVLRRVPELLLLFVGEPEREIECFDAVRDQVAELGLGGRTRFLPYQQDIRHVEAAADVIVLPSEHEPLGRCLLEAMAMQVPVVVSASGGSPEIVRQRETGLLFPVGNAGALSEVLSESLLDADLRRKLARGGRSFAEAELSLPAHAERVQALYERLLPA